LPVTPPPAILIETKGPPMTDAPIAAGAKEITRLFRTLSDETRFRLLRLLGREELTVNELATITQLAQPRISNHLKILREENLIVERRAGSWRHYRVDIAELENGIRALWPALEASWNGDTLFTADDKRLAEVLAARSREPRGGFFDDLAERWDDLRGSLFGDALGREVLGTFLPPGLVVADIGTGTGYMLNLFGARAKKLIAIDNSEAMLAHARGKMDAAGLRNVEFRLADAETSPLSPGEADVVTVVQVLHHLADPGAVIASLAVGLKPGGRFVVSDFLQHEESWLREELHHRWNGFPRARIEEWFRAAGLAPMGFDVLPGRTHVTPEDHRLRIPDGFTAWALKA